MEVVGRYQKLLAATQLQRGTASRVGAEGFVAFWVLRSMGWDEIVRCGSASSLRGHGDQAD
jgi:hypothetical protein